MKYEIDVFGRPGGQTKSSSFQGAMLANRGNLDTEKSNKNRDAVNLVSAGEMENPGALAGATGAKNKAGELRGKEYRKANRGAMARHAKDRHKRAAKVLGYALTTDAPDTWAQASQLFAARLTRFELASLAFSALRALHPEDRALIASAAEWEAQA